MKKLFLLSAAVLLMFAACKKDDNGSGSGESIGPVPSSFTKKALIEEFTGCWCGYCPDGATVVNETMAQFPGRVYGAAIHEGDPMEIGLYAQLDNKFNVTGFPTGMVSRTAQGSSVPISRSSWKSVAQNVINAPAFAGVAMKSSIEGNTISVEVHTGFLAALPGNYKVTAYILEDGVTGGNSYNQVNYYNNDASSPFYQMGNPIVGYVHDHVVRKVLSANLGDPVEATALVALGKDVKNYTFDIPLDGLGAPLWNSANLKLIAFVHRDGGTATTSEILNVQKSKIGIVKNWD